MPEYRGSGLGTALLTSWLDLQLTGDTQGWSWPFSVEPTRHRLLPQPGGGCTGRVDRVPAKRRGARRRGNRSLTLHRVPDHSAKRLSDTVPPMARANPAMASGMRPCAMASPKSAMPINDGTTTSNTNVIAVTSVTARPAAGPR